MDETENSLLAVLALLDGEDELRLQMFERTTCVLTELDKLPAVLWLPALQSERLRRASSTPHTECVHAGWKLIEGASLLEYRRWAEEDVNDVLKVGAR